MSNESQYTIHEHMQANWLKQSLDYESSLEEEEMELKELRKLVV